MQAKPFLKWAGGKSRIISEIEKLIPQNFKNEKITYIEPFVGGGSVLFWILNNYPNLQKIIINDINIDLINTYKVIKQSPKKLITFLKTYQEKYYCFENDSEGRKVYYIEQRNLFNSRKSDNIVQAALFIFLNRTCFNGLYRVNKKNEFNVPIGSYNKPLICDEENLLNVSRTLKNVKILSGDYRETLKYTEEKTLFYLDPPYKPINKVPSFNYTHTTFNDFEQIRLRDFCKELDFKKCNWILSNSDVKTMENEDHFFDDLYSDYEINRVIVKRFINNNSKKKQLKELLIANKIAEEVLLVHN
ncbi:DNA adenine methylase [Flavobacterium oreochromis]|uniref:site-specific DNA-methyltransferase (adenine-specific) n=1 Tax=Flavobacterium columnare TaxID=996 RepID=A0A2D0AHU9_9FLAO|nr:Dam family site-specific DNA-(adenine-N6)-methyltransferase [Flavobacterium oreochromis]OWP77682.1 modification methylase [Flavobacterium oreochromis]